MIHWSAAFAAALVVSSYGSSGAEKPPEAKRSGFDEISWVKGPAEVELGKFAKLKIPAGYVFCPEKDVPKFLAATHNPPGKGEGVLLAPGDTFSVFFEFEETGYVKDDEKDKLKADDIMKSLREGNEEGNKYRESQGWGRLEIAGWEKEPYYDNDTHSLTWAIRARSARSEGINYFLRILGRSGVMHVELVVSPAELAGALPVFKSVLAGYDYQPGMKYTEYRAGDKIAKYGLAALVAGGAAVGAAKLGLFAKLGKFLKPILIGVAAFFAAIWRFVRRFFTGKSATEGNDRPG